VERFVAPQVLASQVEISMSEHERTIIVNASAEQAFRYLSSVSNLPEFVPHLRGLREDENEHVFGMLDLGQGREREVSGFFRAEEDTRRLEWESDGTPGYSGWLQVSEEDGGRSRITAHISMDSAAAEEAMPQPGLAAERIEGVFDSVMGTIRSRLEGNVTPSRSAA
jgi:uncharacterized membrane protein